LTVEIFPKNRPKRPILGKYLDSQRAQLTSTRPKPSRTPPTRTNIGSRAPASPPRCAHYPPLHDVVIPLRLSAMTRPLRSHVAENRSQAERRPGEHLPTRSASVSRRPGKSAGFAGGTVAKSSGGHRVPLTVEIFRQKGPKTAFSPEYLDSQRTCTLTFAAPSLPLPTDSSHHFRARRHLHHSSALQPSPSLPLPARTFTPFQDVFSPLRLNVLPRPLRGLALETVAGPGGGRVGGHLSSRKAFTCGWGYCWVCLGELWLSCAVAGLVVTCLAGKRLPMAGVVAGLALGNCG